MSNSFLKTDLLKVLSESNHGLSKYLSERYTREITREKARLDESANEGNIRELEVFMVNTSMLEDQIEELKQKLYDMHVSGKYNPKVAYRLWNELVDMGAMVYTREYGTKSSEIFTRDDRVKLSKQMMNDFNSDVKNDDPDIQHLKRN